MDDAQLKQYLGKTGMACFMTHLSLFSDAHPSNADIIQRLIETDRIKLSSARTKLSKARAIIGAGRTRDAVELVAASQKTDDEAVLAARRWLTENLI